MKKQEIKKTMIGITPGHYKKIKAQADVEALSLSAFFRRCALMYIKNLKKEAAQS